MILITFREYFFIRMLSLKSYEPMKISYKPINTGHGGTLMNQAEYDEDGIMHELLAPGDFRETGVGVLMDDELYSSFVTKVPDGVHAVAVIDTCHPASYKSGKSSAIDLPYVFASGDEQLRYSEGFRPGRMLMAADAAPSESKSKKKKKKKHDEEENDVSESYEESPKSKKKSKSKKKKSKEEHEDHYGEELEVEKSPKKKKKKSKKKKE